MSETTNHEVLFMQLIMQQQQWAMMSMGKLKNPMSDKIERNLEMSKYAIDTLDMLATKTKGNLGEYEEKFINEVLRELKLNYVEEVEKDKKEKTASPEVAGGEEKPPEA
ncbi:MAG: DUF1844 domain-containing protein [Ignavibacteriaceae bacterium]|nr:DUF1844 domain-containing protein [Ignavibacteriaceae bacterium]